MCSWWLFITKHRRLVIVTNSQAGICCNCDSAAAVATWKPAYKSRSPSALITLIECNSAAVHTSWQAGATGKLKHKLNSLTYSWWERIKWWGVWVATAKTRPSSCHQLQGGSVRFLTVGTSKYKCNQKQMQEKYNLFPAVVECHPCALNGSLSTWNQWPFL